MDQALLNQLMAARKRVCRFDCEKQTYRYRLASFSATYMQPDAVPGTPFRRFETVPNNRPSSRRQNTVRGFDPYVDTMFDYPNLMKSRLGSQADAMAEYRWHLTLQVPHCGMNCWHCYNPKSVCDPGLSGERMHLGETKEYTAKQIWDEFLKVRGVESAERSFNVLRISGGEPFLVPELIAELLRLSRECGGENVGIWTETNLTTWVGAGSTKSVFEQASDEARSHGLDVQSILTEHANRLIVHPCFHGLSDRNIEECTGTSGISFRDLLEGFTCLHTFGNRCLALYPTLICEASDPDHVADVFSELRDIDRSYPLKVALISVDAYPAIYDRRDQTGMRIRPYARYGVLKRWDDLLQAEYGLAYAQIPRHLASAVAEHLDRAPIAKGHGDAKPYKPLIVLLKSVFRREYQQALLTLIAAPEGTEVTEVYDAEHLEKSLYTSLRAGLFSSPMTAPRVLILYANPDARDGSAAYVPIRFGSLTEVSVQDRLVLFRVRLAEYAELKKDKLASLHSDFVAYFGRANLHSKPGLRWAFLGEESLLPINGTVASSGDRAVREHAAWEHLLDLTAKEGPLARLHKDSIFLQLLPSGGCKLTDPPRWILREGDVQRFDLYFYIPDFESYDKDAERRPSRTLKITTTAPHLRIEGYQPRPLPKYGRIQFSLVCDQVDHDSAGQMLIEAEDQSPDCPRIVLEIQSKKGGAPGC